MHVCTYLDHMFAHNICTGIYVFVWVCFGFGFVHGGMVCIMHECVC